MCLWSCQEDAQKFAPPKINSKNLRKAVDDTIHLYILNLYLQKRSTNKLNTGVMQSKPIIAVKGVRVVSTKYLAEAYGVDDISITKNFNNNKSRYVEGKHYFNLKGQDLKNFSESFPDFGVSKMVRSLYLWTERGALYHAKSLGTDQAWEVFDLLVESYFQRKMDGKTDHERQLLRIASKENRKLETDEIKKYVEYCVNSGMDSKKANRYYSTITTETYKALGLKGKRDDMNAQDLMQLQVAEQVIGVALCNAISNSISCRECYYVAKDQLLAYAKIVNSNNYLEK